MKKLVFVYNADSGLFNLVTDMAHKIFSPGTYPCSLCAITHSNLGMRQEWKAFLETLTISLEFLHRDEFIQSYGENKTSLPAIFILKNNKLELVIPAEKINAIKDISGLKKLVAERV